MCLAKLRFAFSALLMLACFGCHARTPASNAPSSQSSPTVELRWEDLPAAPKNASSAVPVNLTASDGTGIELAALQVRGAVEGPLAFTELSFTFENVSQRVLEGTFTIDLPPTGSVHRFAMRIGGLLQEGEIVERQKAEQTFEAFLHKRV